MSGIASPSLSDAQANQLLDIVRKQLQLALTSPTHVQPGQPVTAAVIPSVPVIDVSELANGVLNLAWLAKDVLFDSQNPVGVPTTTDMTSPGELDGDELADTVGGVVAGQPLLRPLHLNLAWAAKDVIFDNPDPVDVPSGTSLEGDDLLTANALVAGGQPLQPPAPVIGLPTPTTSNVPGTLGQVFGGINIPATDPPADLPTVPGVLNQIFGTVGLPRLKVQLKVRWVVRDHNGTELQEGKDFIAMQGLTSPTVSLILPPAFRELRLDTLQNLGGSVVCLSAEVTLTLEAKTLTFTLGPVPILLLPLLIPTIVVLFSEPSFGLTHDSAALIVVPKHSPFASAEPLFKTLKKIEAVVSALRGLGGLAAFFLGLDELLGTVPEQPRLRFAATNQIPKLGDIKIKRRPWYNILGGDPNFDDKVFSLIVFGLPGTKVQFFNDINFKMRPISTQGNFDVELRNSAPDLDFFVAVRTLDTDDDVAPETFPPDRALRFEGDPSGDDKWHTDMSSLRFHSDWLDDAAEEIRNPLGTPPLICKQKGDVPPPKK